jgi:hypothetical protein
MFDGHIRIIPAFGAAVLDQKLEKKRLNFQQTFHSSQTAFMEFVKWRESSRARKLLIEPRTEQP